MNSTQTDRIEKKIVLKAPRTRVWSAITDSKEFGEWFGCSLEGAFVAGSTVLGITTHPDYAGYPLEIAVERIEPESLFAYRWHPGADDKAFDYSDEPMTTVEFHLQDVEGGTQLTIVEKGFDQMPLARQAAAFRGNDEGWGYQLQRIEQYVGA